MSINQMMGTRHYKPVDESQPDLPCGEVGSEFDANRYLAERRHERTRSYVTYAVARSIVTRLKVWAFILVCLLGVLTLLV